MVEKKFMKKKKSETTLIASESKMKWLPSLRNSKAIFIEENKDYVWKIRHIKKNLKDNVLIFFNNNYLNILH